MIKSQDELNKCNDGKRSSEVLIKTIEKCERLQKQLDVAIKGLKKLLNIGECKNLSSVYEIAERHLAKIKELENV